jgi:hypothetical protein
MYLFNFNFNLSINVYLNIEPLNKKKNVLINNFMCNKLLNMYVNLNKNVIVLKDWIMKKKM